MEKNDAYRTSDLLKRFKTTRVASRGSALWERLGDLRIGEHVLVPFEEAAAHYKHLGSEIHRRTRENPYLGRFSVRKVNGAGWLIIRVDTEYDAEAD